MTKADSQGEGNELGGRARGIDEDAFEHLLDYIRRNRGFDFTGYKRPSLVRRVTSRMNAVKCESLRDYHDLLQVDPQEFTALFDTILINVTGFFRDPAAWECLKTDVIPELLAKKPAHEPIRVWSAGCASGEEAYTLAILLAEELGIEQVRQRVKIYGTDVDEGALQVARHATYTQKAVSGIPDDLLARYLEQAGSNYMVRSDLRRSVIFGRHDLVHAAPISHIDLLACRNTLMYLNAQTRSRVLSRLHFALEDHGILFLGRAEMLLSHGHLFAPVDSKRRIFAKVPKDDLRDRLAVIDEGGDDQRGDYAARYRRVRDMVADGMPAPLVVVHNSGAVAMVNSTARRIFGLAVSDIGRPFQDLELSYRPAELRSALEKVFKEDRPLVLEQVEWHDGPDDIDCFEIHVVPISDGRGDIHGAAVTFVDVTLAHRLRGELEHSNRDLAAAYEELQSTTEGLETTNEELQSAIEELETTNEELQSTNEELETMIAELHSTNEELQTINDELRRRTAELDEVNDFLESLLISHPRGLVVLDCDMRISVWNEQSAELWGLRPDEAPGQHFLNLDIGLPVEELRGLLKAILSGDTVRERIVLNSTNRRGKEFHCQVSLAPLLDRRRDIRGAILLMGETTD